MAERITDQSARRSLVRHQEESIMTIKLTKILVALTAALAIPALASSVVLASPEPAPMADEDGPFTYSLECGDQYTLISDARAGGELLVHTRSVQCKGQSTAVGVLVVNKAGEAKMFCMDASQPCSVQFSKGSAVSIGITGGERSGEQPKVRGAVKYN
jgi:hypothetical protein